MLDPADRRSRGDGTSPSRPRKGLTGANARSYLDAFFQNLNWDEVNRRTEQAKAK
jgi:hypothetical protein